MGKQAGLSRATLEISFEFWSERRCADGFAETAVGHYFWYFSTLVLVVIVILVTTVTKMA